MPVIHCQAESTEGCCWELANTSPKIMLYDEPRVGSTSGAKQQILKLYGMSPGVINCLPHQVEGWKFAIVF
jgi:hypothetical protein